MTILFILFSLTLSLFPFVFLHNYSHVWLIYFNYLRLKMMVENKKDLSSYEKFLIMHIQNSRNYD